MQIVPYAKSDISRQEPIFSPPTKRVSASPYLTIDVGMDLGSAVPMEYHDRVPFKFNGKIERVNVKYID